MIQGTRPSISVVLPVYNGARYLNAAIESVLLQTAQAFELLAFDDGSTDTSLSILRRYAQRDSRVIVFTRENRGLVATLNEMVAMARGDYLARMDADDICLPDRLSNQLHFLEHNLDHVVIGTLACHIDHAGRKIGTPKLPTSHEAIDSDHLRGHCSIVHPSAMIRTEAIRHVHGYRAEYKDAEDLDLWLRLAEHGKLANLGETLMLYRLHEKSISQKAGETQRSAALRATRDAWARRGIAGTFEATDHWRPGSDQASRHHFALQYGWTAWSNGYRRTWWSYCLQAVRLAPFKLSSWQLLIGGLLKRPLLSGKPED